VSLKTTNELPLHPWLDQSEVQHRTVRDELPITSYAIDPVTFSDQVSPREQNAEV
jgi:hypothetical protein